MNTLFDVHLRKIENLNVKLSDMEYSQNMVVSRLDSIDASNQVVVNKTPDLVELLESKASREYVEGNENQ